MEPSRSATTIAKVRCYHVIKIDGYSKTLNSHGDRPVFSSSPFRAGGHSWHVSYRPMGSPHYPENTEFISIYLVLDDITEEPVMAEVAFTLLNRDGTPAKKTCAINVNNFSVRAFVGYEKFIKREELETSEFLKDDSFAIRVHVLIIREAPYVTVPPPDLHQHLGHLLASKEDADVEIEVGGERFPAHRLVLAARSPVFMAQLFGSMKVPDTTKVIRVHDMEPRVFDALLTFMYTDAWPEHLQEEGDEPAIAQHLLVAADRYGLQRLKLMCEDRLCNRVTAASVTTVLALAELHCCDRLKEACFEFLLRSSTTMLVLESQELEFLAQSCPTVLIELARILKLKLRFSCGSNSGTVVPSLVSPRTLARLSRDRLRLPRHLHRRPLPGHSRQPHRSRTTAQVLLKDGNQFETPRSAAAASDASSKFCKPVNAVILAGMLVVSCLFSR
ncbi:hypothetical protein EJB05_30307, partial [Eragrostis curvula]